MRITVSRLNPEPTPKVGFIGDPVLVDDEWIELRGTGQEVELPPELWLRELLALDLDDNEAVVAFCQHYGFLGRLDWAAFPTAVRNTCRPRMQGHTDLDAIHEAVMDRLSRSKSAESWDRRSFHHIGEFVVHATALRDLARIWLAHATEEPLAYVTDQWESTFTGRPRTIGQAQLWLAQFLTAGLGEYHLGVELAGHTAWKTGGTYAGVCLQLANEIDENVSYRSCANDRCGRVFYRQRGRAAKGQYKRRGVAYCSVECARAQAQRDWRQRKTEMDESEDR